MQKLPLSQGMVTIGFHYGRSSRNITPTYHNSSYELESEVRIPSTPLTQKIYAVRNLLTAKSTPHSMSICTRLQLAKRPYNREWGNIPSYTSRMLPIKILSSPGPFHPTPSSGATRP